MSAFTGIKENYDDGESIIDQILRVAKTRSEYSACVGIEGALSYRELLISSESIAQNLLRQGMKEGDVIAIAVERCLDLCPLILGILRIGACFLPIDLRNGSQRLSEMFNIASVRICVVESPREKRRLEVIGFTSVVLEQLRMDPCQSCEVPLLANKNREIYVLFTSGSTGTPKGVTVRNAALSNRLHWMASELHLSSIDIFIQKTPLTFDVSMWEVFLPLLIGATLVIPHRIAHLDPQLLNEVISNYNVNIIHFVPSLLARFLESGVPPHSKNSLKHIVCSGEVLYESLALQTSKYFAEACIWNFYGPTEAAIDVLFFQYEPDSSRMTVPIGRPIANTSVFLLDSKGEPAQFGSEGEIVIGGIAPSAEYLKNKELTDKKFPVMTTPNGKVEQVYRTGDIGTIEPNGFVYRGRLDFEAKIQGVRINLEELEASIGNTGYFRDVAAIAKKNDQTMVTTLHVFVTCVDRSEEKSEKIQERIRKHLPMGIKGCVAHILPEMPLMASGKISRKDLERLAQDSISLSDKHLLLHHSLDALGIWSEVLSWIRVNLTTNIFEAGASSIHLMQALSKMRAKGYSNLSYDTLVNYPIIADLQSQLEMLQSASVCPSADFDANLPRDLYPHEELIWAHEFRLSTSLAYKIPFLLQVDAWISLEAILSTLKKVVAKYPILTADVEMGDISPRFIPSRRLDISVTGSVPDRASLPEWIITEIQSSAQSPNLNLTIRISSLAEGRWLFLGTINHLVFDEESFAIFFNHVHSELLCVAAHLKIPSSQKMISEKKVSFSMEKGSSNASATLRADPISLFGDFRGQALHRDSWGVDDSILSALLNYTEKMGVSLATSVLNLFGHTLIRFFPKDGAVQISIPISLRGVTVSPEAIGCWTQLWPILFSQDESWHQSLLKTKNRILDRKNQKHISTSEQNERNNKSRAAFVWREPFPYIRPGLVRFEQVPIPDMEPKFSLRLEGLYTREEGLTLVLSWPEKMPPEFSPSNLWETMRVQILSLNTMSSISM